MSELSSDRPEDRIVRLPVFQLAGAIYQFVFTHFRDLVKTGAVWFAIYFAYLWALHMLTGDALEGIGTRYLVANILPIVVALAFTPFLARWHRYVLFGPAHEPAGTTLRFGPRERKFAGYVIQIALLVALMGIALFIPVALLVETADSAWPARAGAYSVLAFTWAVVFWAMFRLSLVLPAAAAGLQTSLKTAWEQTRGNSLRMFALIFMTGVPLGFLSGVVDELIPVSNVAVLITKFLVASFFEILLLGLGATTLSQVYLTLVGVPDDSGAVGDPADT